MLADIRTCSRMEQSRRISKKIKFRCVQMNKKRFSKESRVNLREQRLWKVRTSRCQMLRCRKHSTRGPQLARTHPRSSPQARHDLCIPCRCGAVVCAHICFHPHILYSELAAGCAHRYRLDCHHILCSCICPCRPWHARCRSGDFARGVSPGRGHGRHRARRPAHRL